MSDGQAVGPDQLKFSFDLSLGRATVDSSWAHRSIGEIDNPHRTDPVKAWLRDHAGQEVSLLDRSGPVCRVEAADGTVCVVPEGELHMSS